MKDNKSEFSDSKFFRFLQKYWLYIVMLLAVVIVVLSSVNIYREEVLDIDPDVKYEEQNSLSFASATLDTLNPIVSNSEDTYYLTKLIYNGLFRYTDNLNAEGDLVESYSVDTEKAYIDIKLKDGIKWHDGSDFTAKDVRFTINAIKSYGSEGIYYKNASKIYSVNVKDNLNLRIYFSNNYDCSLDDLTFPILPSSKYSSAGKLINDKENFAPVGTGQYKYSSYDSLRELALVPNEAYYGIKAQNSIQVKILPDKSVSPNMLEISSVTCYADKSSQRKSLVADKNLQMYDIVSNDVDFLVFNTSREIFASKNMRQAVCYSIDKEEILADGYMDDGVLSDTIYYPGFLGVEESGEAYKLSSSKALELLEKEGYKDEDLNGKLEDESGESISINILVNNDNANRIAAAKIMTENLRDIGFEVSTTSVPRDEYKKLIEEKNFDILITGYEIDASYDLRQFFDGTNSWGYSNDDMLEKAREMNRLHTAEEYTGIYKELKEIMMDEVPYYAICYKKMGLIGIETFEAEQLPMFNDIYRNCHTWSWKKVIKEDTEKGE